MSETVEQDKLQPQRSQATRLVNLASDVEFFHSPDGEAWGTLPTDGHREHRLLRNKAFRHWLARRYYEQEKKAPGAQALQDAIGVLQGRALYDGTTHRVWTRIAECDGALYLDLANDRWEAIQITARGWQVVANPPVRFRRTNGMLPLPYPITGSSLSELRPFINVGSEDDWILLQAWLIMALRARGPYPLLDLSGEQGSTKSTQGRVCRSLIDPSAAPLRTVPREERDLLISATAGWVLAFDNLSYLPQWLSDAFCRLATGGGFATRELYTDSDEVIFDAQRPVLYTAIEDIAVSGDLVDRLIRLSLPPIPESRRLPESIFWHRFEIARPRILGALLTAVSGALQNLSTIRLERLPRMADFAVWVTAGESALGWKPGTFLSVYTQNRESANDLALDSSLVAMSVKGLIEKGPWEGDAKTLLDTLTESIPEKDAKAKTWPKNALALANALRRLAPNLRAAGISIEFWREPGGKRQRKIQLAQVEHTGNGASPASQTQQTQEAGGTLWDVRDDEIPTQSNEAPIQWEHEL